MRLATDMICAAGGRPYNEDHCNFVMLEAAGCWVLADGLGGHGGGEIASQLAVDTILSCFTASPEVSPSALHAYIEAANHAIVERQTSDPNLLRMGCTLVVLLSDLESALWAHMGDSRLYHFRGGRVAAQTKDHSVAQALADAGDIKPAEIRFHPDRSSLRRSLGKSDQLQPAILQRPVTIERGDAFLLASDGFWEYVTETEMEIELSKAATPAEWLGSMQERLIRAVPEDHDNFSAIAVCAPV